MTDNTPDPGPTPDRSTPDRSEDASDFVVNESGEANPPTSPPTSPPSSPDAPTAPPAQQFNTQTSDALPAEEPAVPVVNAPAMPAASVAGQSQPDQSQPDQTQAAAYPTDAFGRPIETATASSSA